MSAATVTGRLRTVTARDRCGPGKPSKFRPELGPEVKRPERQLRLLFTLEAGWHDASP